jgi:hypothetical protein
VQVEEEGSEVGTYALRKRCHCAISHTYFYRFTSIRLLPLLEIEECRRRTTTNIEWTILYFEGAFKGKAEFLRLMLEDAGVPYTCQSDNLVGPKGSMCAFRGSPAAIDDDEGTASGPFPTLYPPAIWHRPQGDGEEEVLVNHDGACMMYLAEELGYEPSSSAERARANAILLNALDWAQVVPSRR